MKVFEEPCELPLGCEVFYSFYYFLFFKRLLETKIKSVISDGESVALSKKTRELEQELFVCFLLLFGVCPVDQYDALGLEKLNYV